MKFSGATRTRLGNSNSNSKKHATVNITAVITGYCIMKSSPTVILPSVAHGLLD